MKIKNLAAIFAAITLSATLGGCAASSSGDGADFNQDEIYGEVTAPPAEEPDVPSVSVPEPPKKKTVSYISVTRDGVNIRAGAGTGYSAVGTAEKSTMYEYIGEEEGWYKTKYRNKTVYISKKYCVVTEMTKSDNERIEAVIAEGTSQLGVPYVYGAVRLHDGNGNFLKGFSTKDRKSVV